MGSRVAAGAVTTRFPCVLILLVDDSADIRETFGAVLEAEGYEVRAVASGDEALREAGRTRPDLVITDATMPGMSGLDLVTHLRSDFARPPPIAMISGLTNVAPEALARGAATFLAKPIALDDLLGAVRRLLGDPGAVGALSRARANTEARRTETTREAERVMKRLLRDDALVDRQTRLARWTAALFECDCLAFIVAGGRMHLSATSKPSLNATTSDGAVARVAADVLQTDASLLVTGTTLERALRLPVPNLVATPIRYDGRPIGVALLLRDGEQAFQTADLRGLELVVDRAAARIADGSDEPNEPLFTWSSFESLVGIWLMRVAAGRNVMLTAVRTKAPLREPIMSLQDPLFAQTDATIACLGPYDLCLVGSRDGTLAEYRARISDVLQRVDELWGCELAVVTLTESSRRPLGRRLVRRLHAMLDTAQQPSGTTLWLEQGPEPTAQAPLP